jgi:hypothetical protein
LTSPFSMCMSFISLSCFTDLAKNSSTTLNKSGEIQALVAHACNPRFSGDWDHEDYSLSPAQNKE